MPTASLRQLLTPPSLSLLTDLYHHDELRVLEGRGWQTTSLFFNLFYRQNPSKGGYGIAAGLEQAIDLVTNSRFQDEDLQYLASLNGNDGEPLFEDAFFSTTFNPHL